MRKLLIFFLIGLFLLPSTVSAAVTFDLNDVRAVINADDIVQVDKNIILDASQSFAPDENKSIFYEWDFGDGSPIERGIEAVHSYNKPGEYLVKLTVTQAGESNSISRDIFAYEKLVLLLTDINERKESVNNLT